jgi:3-deoxy-D-manno-octulosonic-acid transferase
VIYAAYNLLLLCLAPLGLALLGWRLLTRPEYREALAERFGRVAASPDGRPVLWLHAVSVGEVISARPLTAALRERHPAAHLVVSCGTPTGRAMARTRLSGADRVIYLPWDLPGAVRAALAKVRPDLFVLVESELWPNLLRALARRGTPVVLVNGRISRASYRRYLAVRPLFRAALAHVGAFLMQSRSDAQHILAMGAPTERVEVVGNIKYDQPVALHTPEELARLGLALGLAPGALVLLAGSTHEGEEEMLTRVWQRLVADAPGLVLVLAVRHPNRCEAVVEALSRMGAKPGRKTLGNGAGRGVVLLDTLGELSAHYRLATVAFVGGSLVPVGGHNPLEPAAAGVPVVYGPHVGNFEAPCAELERAGAAVRVAGEEDLVTTLRRLLRDPEARHRMGEEGARVVRENRGAVAHTMARIARFLPEGPERAAP